MNILVVDENKKDRDGLKDTLYSLEPSGQIDTAADTYGAILLAEKKHYQIAYIRIQSKIDGLFLARKLQLIYPRINVVFVSDSEEYAGCTWQVYPSGYLLMPVERATVLENLLNLRYPLKEN